MRSSGVSAHCASKAEAQLELRKGNNKLEKSNRSTPKPSRGSVTLTMKSARGSGLGEDRLGATDDGKANEQRESDTETAPEAPESKQRHQ